MRAISEEILLHRRRSELETRFNLTLPQVEAGIPYLEWRSGFVLKHYFKLDGEECLTNVEMGEILGLSSDRVRQIKTKALNTIRENSGGQ